MESFETEMIGITAVILADAEEPGAPADDGQLAAAGRSISFYAIGQYRALGGFRSAGVVSYENAVVPSSNPTYILVRNLSRSLGCLRTAARAFQERWKQVTNG